MIDLKVVDGRVTLSEGERLEFKSCRNALSRDFWPTYSSFANTFGGTIVMGVSDSDHQLTGVDDPDKVLKEMWDLLNDEKKVSSNLLTPDDIKVADICGKTVILVSVPRAERRRRPVFVNGSIDNGTYRRNGEGDYHCSLEELKQLMRDSSDTPQDSDIIAAMEMGDLDPRSVKSYRERVSNRNPAHPWNDREDDEFLRLIGACSRSGDGRMHPTLAGLLMFGYDYSIMSVLPNYHLDYLEFADGSDRWTYRLDTGTGEFTGNVYSFLTEVSNRLSVVNGRGKEVEGMTRIDDSVLIRMQRELIVNALAHADYEGRRGIRIEWRADSFTVRNPGNLRVSLEDMFEGGISDPRNPHLALMIGLLGMAERAGSGVSDVVSSCRRTGMPDPIYLETVNPETVTVMLSTVLSTGSFDLEEAIQQMMRRDPGISLDTMAKRTGVDRNKLARIINKLKKAGSVRREGGTRGRWIVI